MAHVSNRIFGQLLRNQTSHNGGILSSKNNKLKQPASSARRESEAFGSVATRSRLPKCLKRKSSEQIDEVVSSMTHIVNKQAYLPTEVCNQYRAKHNLSAEEVKQIYFYVLKRKQQNVSQKGDQSFRSDSRSYREQHSSFGTPRECSNTSFMSISDGAGEDIVMVRAEPPKESKLAEILRNGGTTLSYATRVWANLLEASAQYSLEGCDLLAKSSQLNHSMRTILIDWLHEVSQEYNLEWQTLLLSIMITDRFLNFSDVQKTNLQLVGVTSLWIASKLEEIHPPPVHDFTYISDDAYTYTEVIRFEAQMLNTLHWNVTIPTPFDFLVHLLIFFPEATALKENVKMFIDIFLQHKEFTHKTPSHVATAALLLATLYDRKHSWMPELTTYTGYTLGDLMGCARKINQAFGQAVSRKKVVAAYQKHSRCSKHLLYTHAKWNSLNPSSV